MSDIDDVSLQFKMLIRKKERIDDKSKKFIQKLSIQKVDLDKILDVIKKIVLKVKLLVTNSSN